MRVAWLLSALSALAVSPGASAAPLRVGLVVHPVVNVSDGDSRAIAVELAQAMSKRFDAKIFVADRSKLPLEIPEDCVSDMGCSGELADRAAADRLLYLVMVRIGQAIEIEATWVDPQSGKVVPRDPFELDGPPAERSRIIAEVAPSMVPRGEAKAYGEVSTSKPPPKLEPGPVAASRPSTGEIPISAWVVGGASAVALLSGVVVVLSSLGDYDAVLQRACPNAMRCEEDLDRYSQRTALGSGLLIGGALAGALSIALFASSGAEEPELTSAPTIGLDRGVQLGWGGRF